MKISTVINTYNEEKNLDRCLESIKDFSDEIVVVDMHSDDKTVDIAKKYSAKVFLYEHTRYVEPARNFALSKAQGDWILLIDADEELPEGLIKELKKVSARNEVDFVQIPRKNIIFGKWIQHSRWWPDYLVRFFKKGKVKFSEKIHVPPTTEGNGLTLEAKQEYAIIHHNFQTISQFIERLNRYSDIQANEVIKQGEKFNGVDLIAKPGNEFFSRFFAGSGYKDGIHGLVLSFLQSFSELVVVLKVWEKQGFEQVPIRSLGKAVKKTIADFYYWQSKTSSSILEKIYFRIKRKI